MKINLLKWFMMLALAALPVLANISCSGGGFGSGNNKAATDDEDDDEETSSTEPVQIAGAFLTCAEVDGGSSSDSTAQVGCGVYVKDSNGAAKKAADGEDVEDLSFSVSGSSSLQLTAGPLAYQDGFSPMHIKFSVPRSELNSTKVSATLKDLGLSGAQRTLNENLSGDILECTESGWMDCAVDSSECMNSTMTLLTSFPADASWEAGDSALSMYYFVPDHFCRNGVINSSVQSGGWIQTNNAVLGDDRQIPDTLVKPGGTLRFPQSCVDQVKHSTDAIGGDLTNGWAHFYNGCYFVRSGPKLFITSERSVSQLEAADSCNPLIERLKSTSAQNACN